MLSPTQNLGLRATSREIKVLKFMYQYENDEIRFYDIADKFHFGDERSNVGLKIVLEDLEYTGLIEENYDTGDYSITNKGDAVVQQMIKWDKRKYG